MNETKKYHVAERGFEHIIATLWNSKAYNFTNIHNKIMNLHCNI